GPRAGVFLLHARRRSVRAPRCVGTHSSVAPRGAKVVHAGCPSYQGPTNKGRSRSPGTWVDYMEGTRSLGLKAHTVVKVEEREAEGERELLIHVERLGQRRLRCGVCGLQAQRVAATRRA